jgi:hypothetical protein
MKRVRIETGVGYINSLMIRQDFLELLCPIWDAFEARRRYCGHRRQFVTQNHRNHFW